MEKTNIKIKHKNTLRHLILLLLAILLLVAGLAGYAFTKDQGFFYLIAGSNILIVWILYKSQVRKNQVIYDAVFVKYRLNDNPVERIKTDDIQDVERKDNSLILHLREQDPKTIDLEEYTEESIEEFKRVISFYF
ncbi:hypothetical protein [Salegentibacter chungangensis]|uniref:Uncharacterized protein n=1 Tax=Salegentibacter chungangensis TaxID=1335724 RepID=A0ABW3NPD7_9FLAO